VLQRGERGFPQSGCFFRQEHTPREHKKKDEQAAAKLQQPPQFLRR
jgi:hypothetical protein